MSNCLDIGFRIFAHGNSQITLQNSEVYNNGSRTGSSQTGAGVYIQAGNPSHMKITGNRIHDNNSGIEVANSGVPCIDVSDVEVSGNRIFMQDALGDN